MTKFFKKFFLAVMILTMAIPVSFSALTNNSEDMAQIIYENIKKQKIEFIKLQFTDILGVTKNINISSDQLKKAINEGITFDGSSVDGFARIEESDMYLKPDLNTFKVIPSELCGNVNEAIVICDVYKANGEPFEGDPRYILKKATMKAEKLGYTMYVGAEMEFFLFKLDTNGNPTTDVSDNAGYFDLSADNKGYIAVRDICLVLKNMGFTVEAAHHECAPGQHEIDFKYEDALKSADNIIFFKEVTQRVAKQHGLHASFLPKPISNIAGSGMHINQSLFKDGRNAFYDPKDKIGLSKIAYNYMAGLLEHAKGMSILTNSKINSYKRLNSGHEAPKFIAWATQNRSPLIRVPAGRGNSTRLEMRNPDPSCNPYLAIASLLSAGLDGIETSKIPPECVNHNIYKFTNEDLDSRKIESLPENLIEALACMLNDEIIKNVIGEHVVKCITDATNKEWCKYNEQITELELKGI